MKKTAILLFFLLLGSVLWAQQKYALVIGNGTYTNFGTLKNATNDANDMASTLQNLGFTVDKVLDGNLNQMENAVIRLRDRLSGAGGNAYGFFYYAGHGVQVDGVNYLIPSNANIPDKDFLRERAIAAQTVLDMLNRSKNVLNIIVLDACRDFPAAWSRSADRGLAVMHPPTDSIIMYSTAAGRTASDGSGRNGLFTTHLLNHLKTPGIEVNEVFRRTMSDVARASNNEQRPAMYTDFSETAYLGSRPAATPAPQPAQAASAANRTASPGFVRVEGGTFQMGNNDNEYDKPVHSVTVSSFYMGRYEVTQKEWVEVMDSNPSWFKGDNLPVECVSWYDALEYCNKRSVKEGLTPAYNINKNQKDWNNTSRRDDLKWMVRWNQNANGYRLPTEAEWEYAAKGGNGSPGNYDYSGSNSADEVAWYERNSTMTTQEVGTKKPNSLGLYDMSGNVDEWCWDWYGDYSSEAQTDPRGAISGAIRVIRGGSWGSAGPALRSDSRLYDSPWFSDPPDWWGNHGFRLVRP